MYLIRRKSDGLAQYLFQEKPRVKKFMTHPIVAMDIKADTHEVIVVEPPETWAPGAYFYNKGWVVKNQAAIDKAAEPPEPTKKELALQELKEAKAAQEGKQLSMSYLDKRLEALEKYLGVI